VTHQGDENADGTSLAPLDSTATSNIKVRFNKLKNNSVNQDGISATNPNHTAASTFRGALINSSRCHLILTTPIRAEWSSSSNVPMASTNTIIATVPDQTRPASPRKILLNYWARKIQKQKPSGLSKNSFPESRLTSRAHSIRQNKLIITVTDNGSKWLESRAVRRADTRTHVKFVVEQIICQHGCPKIIQSENGSICTSDFFAAVTENLGIQYKL
jgi:hypothetical protein